MNTSRSKPCGGRTLIKTRRQRHRSEQRATGTSPIAKCVAAKKQPKPAPKRPIMRPASIIAGWFAACAQTHIGVRSLVLSGALFIA
jgi:hypothetical protein